MALNKFKIELRKDNVSSHCIKTTQNFLQHNMPDFISSQEWTTHSTDLNPATLFSLGYLARTCLWRKAWAICEPQNLQNVITDTWHDVDIRQPESEKAILPYWKKRLAAMAKENGGPIQHIFCWSFDWWFGLLWGFGVACVQAATQMMSRLQKSLYGVCRYFVCITANTEVF